MSVRSRGAFRYPPGAVDEYAEGQRLTVAHLAQQPAHAVIDERRANYTDMIFATAVVVVAAVWYVVDRFF